MLFKKKLEHLSSPMDLYYMKTVKFYLCLVNAWPFKEFGTAQRENNKYLPTRNFKTMTIYWIWIFISISMYIRTHIGKLDFYELGHNYITSFMSIVCVQRASMPLIKAYRDIIPEFVLKFHLFHFKQNSEYAIKIYKKVHKISAIFTIIIYMQMYSSVIFFNLTPFYNNIQSGVFKASQRGLENETHYEYAVYYYSISEHNNLIIYAIIFSVNWLIAFDCGLYICTYDLLVSLIVFHIWGHLKMLKHNLKNFPKPNSTQEMNTVEESQIIKKWLVENIEHYKLIMKFMNLTSQAFGLMICVYYIFHQVNGCILLLEISTMKKEALATYGALTLCMFQTLTQISIIFESIATESETIKDAIYDLPWEKMDLKNRKIVLSFLSHTQTPITFKALGLISVGVRTMAEIIKTSFSYYLMLHTAARLEA